MRKNSPNILFKNPVNSTLFTYGEKVIVIKGEYENQFGTVVGHYSPTFAIVYITNRTFLIIPERWLCRWSY